VPDPGVEFAEAARAFCDWAEAPPGKPSAEARRALGLLLRVYSAAIELRDPPRIDHDLEGDSLSHEEWKSFYARFGALPFNYYGSVFDPLVMPPEQSVTGDLADDLADIYGDLREGLSLEHAGHLPEAVAAWTFSFQHHWGRHAASAINALHNWVEREVAW
jgi:hypothetical protein